MALSTISGTTGITDATVTSAKLADFTAAVDLNGVELLLDADADTSISADTDDQIDIKIANADHLKILSSSGDTVLKPMVDAKDIIFQQFDGNKIFCIDDGNFVSVGGNATAPGEIRIYEDTDNGSHYSGFKVGNLTASVAYALPNADGSDGQVLTTDGSGVLTWATASANTPSSADAEALGSASLEWSDLFLADASTIQFGNDQDVTLTHVADTGLLLSSGDQLQFGDAGENISGDGTQLTISSSSHLTLDSGATIILDANTGEVSFKDDGTTIGFFLNESSDFTIRSAVSNKDLLFKGNDGGSVVTALTLDMSAAGAATFNNAITSGAVITSGAGLVIADAGNIGSASDTDAIAISSGGVVTMNQIPVLSAGLNVSGGTIAGTLSTAAQANITSLGTLTTLTVDNVITNGATIGHTSDTDLITLADGIVTVAGEVSLTTLDIGGTNITTTAAEINLIDGGTSRGTTAVADADGILHNDGGTMRMTSAATFKTYFQEGISTAYDDLTAGDAAVLITTSSGNITIDAAASDSDIIFKGTDGGSDRVFATFDGSAGGDLFLNGGLIDLKNDGSNVSQIKFYCESSNAHAQTLIGAPHAQSADNTLTLPDGANGVLLSTTSTATVTNKTLTSPVINTGTFGTSILPTSADGTTLGSASKEFSDLFLADAGTIQLGNDQDVRIIHNADKGVILKHTATADDKPVSLTLQTGETDMAANDVIGAVDFQAPDEGTGTDAILVAAGIEAVAEGDFSSSSNATSLVFKTGASEAAAGKIKVTSAGHLFPMADDSYDLGGASNQWRNIYTGDLHLSNMSKAQGNVVDGTKGDWTIQEGSDELYLMNNNSGKKYKFNLTEV